MKIIYEAPDMSVVKLETDGETVDVITASASPMDLEPEGFGSETPW